MQKTWMIGDLAELLGVSRDTLRIYEEQGLKLTGRLHTYFLYQYEKDGATGFHIAMYAPLAEESEE